EANVSLAVGSDSVRPVAPTANHDRPQYINLDQAAALVGKGKSALEKYKRKSGTQKLPIPCVKGRNGQSDEWEYTKVMKPWLETNFGRVLPERYPSLREI